MATGIHAQTSRQASTARAAGRAAARAARQEQRRQPWAHLHQAIARHVPLDFTQWFEHRVAQAAQLEIIRAAQARPVA